MSRVILDAPTTMPRSLRMTEIVSEISPATRPCCGVSFQSAEYVCRAGFDPGSPIYSQRVLCGKLFEQSLRLLYCSSDGVRSRGAAMMYLAHSASRTCASPRICVSADAGSRPENLFACKRILAIMGSRCVAALSRQTRICDLNAAVNADGDAGRDRAGRAIDRQTSCVFDGHIILSFELS